MWKKPVMTISQWKWKRRAESVWTKPLLATLKRGSNIEILPTVILQGCVLEAPQAQQIVHPIRVVTAGISHQELKGQWPPQAPSQDQCQGMGECWFGALKGRHLIWQPKHKWCQIFRNFFFHCDLFLVLRGFFCLWGLNLYLFNICF